jgi:hypothetical protein
MSTTLEFGDEVKDVITGTQGILTGKSSYITGCDVYGITTPNGKDGKGSDVSWFDENRVVLVKKGKVRIKTSAVDPTKNGGIFDIPKTRK